MILSQSEDLGKMALGIVKIYLGSPFSANRRYSRLVCSRSVCRGQLSWTQFHYFFKVIFSEVISLLLCSNLPTTDNQFTSARKRTFSSIEISGVRNKHFINIFQPRFFFLESTNRQYTLTMSLLNDMAITCPVQSVLKL